MMTTFSFLIPLTLNIVYVYFCTGSRETKVLWEDFGDRKEAGVRIVGRWKVAKEKGLSMADGWTTSRVTLARLRRGDVQNGIGWTET
jgi:hypothetical protein